jgi:hypothetical protein
MRKPCERECFAYVQNFLSMNLVTEQWTSGSIWRSSIGGASGHIIMDSLSFSGPKAKRSANVITGSLDHRYFTLKVKY